MSKKPHLKYNHISSNSFEIKVNEHKGSQSENEYNEKHEIKQILLNACD